jgi:hypothetical protein
METRKVTRIANQGTWSRIRSLLLWGSLCAVFLVGRAASEENPPADTVGVIEGEAISVEGPMAVEVVHGQVKTVLRSGSKVNVKSGEARIELAEGGQIVICGPARFSVLKTAGALTLALDSGTIHAQIAGDVALNVYTAQIQAHPISIGNGAEDVLVGLDAAGAMCIRANKGAMRIEQQLTGQSVIVPQGGDVSLTNGQMESLQSSGGRCACELQTTIKPMVTKTEVSLLGTKDDKKKPTDAKPADPEQADEPVYQVFMPPLRYDAKAKAQADFDPNLIILVRRVRVRPTLILQGRVEGDPVVAKSTAPAPTPAKQAAPPKPAEETTWSRVRSYFRKLWSPAS